MPSLSRLAPRDRARLYARTARRSVRRHGLRPWRALGRLHASPVFVVGCPRSGTTFTAEAIGSVPGFFDLGEVNRLKAAVGALHEATEAGSGAAVVDELRRVLRRSQRVGFAAGRRAVEQTPESTFLVPQLAEAFPQAQFVHILRDGRDVVASLMERGWLARAAPGGRTDDAGLRVGRHARFWVEAGREPEFEESSDARRCAWAWRRYESSAALHLGRLDSSRVASIRYEDLAASPADVAVHLARTLGGPADAFVAGFSGMHAGSVGRYRTALSPDQLAEVEREAGDLLRALGYGPLT